MICNQIWFPLLNGFLNKYIEFIKVYSKQMIFSAKLGVNLSKRIRFELVLSKNQIIIMIEKTYFKDADQHSSTQ